MKPIDKIIAGWLKQKQPKKVPSPVCGTSKVRPPIIESPAPISDANTSTSKVRPSIKSPITICDTSTSNSKVRPTIKSPAAVCDTNTNTSIPPPPSIESPAPVCDTNTSTSIAPPPSIKSPVPICDKAAALEKENMAPVVGKHVVGNQRLGTNKRKQSAGLTTRAGDSFGATGDSGNLWLNGRFEPPTKRICFEFPFDSSYQIWIRGRFQPRVGLSWDAFQKNWSKSPVPICDTTKTNGIVPSSMEPPIPLVCLPVHDASTITGTVPSAIKPASTSPIETNTTCDSLSPLELQNPLDKNWLKCYAQDQLRTMEGASEAEKLGNPIITEKIMESITRATKPEQLKLRVMLEEAKSGPVKSPNFNYDFVADEEPTTKMDDMSKGEVTHIMYNIKKRALNHRLLGANGFPYVGFGFDLVPMSGRDVFHGRYRNYFEDGYYPRPSAANSLTAPLFVSKHKEDALLVEAELLDFFGPSILDLNIKHTRDTPKEGNTHQYYVVLQVLHLGVARGLDDGSVKWRDCVTISRSPRKITTKNTPSTTNELLKWNLQHLGKLAKELGIHSQVPWSLIFNIFSTKEFLTEQLSEDRYFSLMTMIPLFDPTKDDPFLEFEAVVDTFTPMKKLLSWHRECNHRLYKQPKSYWGRTSIDDTPDHFCLSSSCQKLSQGPTFRHLCNEHHRERFPKEHQEYLAQQRKQKKKKRNNLCIVDGCEKRGLKSHQHMCHKHHGESFPKEHQDMVENQKERNQCDVDGCEKQGFKSYQNMCRKHHCERFPKEHHDLVEKERERNQCIVDGCEKKGRKGYKQMCKKHHRERFPKEHHDLVEKERERNQCIVDGCEKKGRKGYKQMCKKHHRERFPKDHREILDETNSKRQKMG